jgi:Flp pilus assembly protein TadD/SAM-dependent methyltransferase
MPANRKPRRAQPRPKTAPAPFERGLALHRAMRLHPNPADRAVAEGEALLNAGHAEDAAVLLTTACQRHPGDLRILALNGRALLTLGRTGPAIGALFMAAELQPGDAKIQAALGVALFNHGDVEQAMVHCLNAFRLVPNTTHASTLSCVLIALGCYPEALVVADHALELRPNCFEALVNRAIALEGLGRFEDAVRAGQDAVAASPDSAVARHNLAVTLLSLGRLTPETWDHYEWRLLLKGKPAWLAAVTRWEGEDIAGRTILLHAEQGLGDTLQFVRYAPLVAARAGRVILAVQPALVRLLRAVPGVDHVVAVGGVLPAFDVVCPLLSLPRLLGTTPDTIPPALPYADQYVPWDDAAGPALRVGLVWSGSKTFADDRQRSLPPAALMGLAGLPGVQFYSLQRHEAGGTAPPPELGVIDLMDGVQDFADTAARVAGLDLVIAVDTAVAHLAATMGKPVWLLSRFRGCWRWLLGRADSPWYPSLRIVRQERPNDWGGVIAQVRQDLAALALQPIARPTAMVSRPEASAPRSCKACGTPSPAMGSVDFNKNCEDRRQAALPLSGRAVTYHRCPACALLFTGDFDAWDRKDFRREIYNESYADVDPDFAGSRPAASAELIGTLFGPACRGLDVLDFGGGDGALAALLASRHGMEAEVYDPFNPACDVAPERRYSLVTCFEVLEHTPDPRATIREVAARVQEDGIVVFSTLLQPGDFAQRGLGWWYVAPRNGHVTIYSAQALRALWAELGFQLISHGDGLHIGYRTVPAFAQGLACFAV